MLLTRPLGDSLFHGSSPSRYSSGWFLFKISAHTGPILCGRVYQLLVFGSLTFVCAGQLSRSSPMGGRTSAIVHPNHPCLIAFASYSTHSPPNCEESSYICHAFRSTRLHHDALLQVFDCQRSSVFLHWNCGTTKFPGRICHQGSKQKRAAYSVGQFPIRGAILRWMAYVLLINNASPH